MALLVGLIGGLAGFGVVYLVTAWSPPARRASTAPTDWSRPAASDRRRSRRADSAARCSRGGSSPPWPAPSAVTSRCGRSSNRRASAEGRAGADHRPGVVVRAAARPAHRRARDRRHDRGDGADVSRTDPTRGRAPGDAAVAAEPARRDPPVRRRARRPVRRSRRVGAAAGDVALVAHQRAAVRARRHDPRPGGDASARRGRPSRPAQRGALHHRLQRRRRSRAC